MIENRCKNVSNCCMIWKVSQSPSIIISSQKHQKPDPSVVQIGKIKTRLLVQFNNHLIQHIRNKHAENPVCEPNAFRDCFSASRAATSIKCQIDYQNKTLTDEKPGLKMVVDEGRVIIL